MKKPQYTRHFETQQLDEIIIPIIKENIGKNGFQAMDIISKWDKIMPAKYSNLTKISRISFPPKQTINGKITIKADSAIAHEIAYIIPQILENINRFFHYDAISKVQIIQSNSFNKIQNNHVLSDELDDNTKILIGKYTNKS